MVEFLIEKADNSLPVWRVSSQAITSTCDKTSSARWLISARFPIGVATIYKVPELTLVSFIYLTSLDLVETLTDDVYYKPILIANSTDLFIVALTKFASSSINSSYKRKLPQALIQAHSPLCLLVMVMLIIFSLTSCSTKPVKKVVEEPVKQELPKEEVITGQSSLARVAELPPEQAGLQLLESSQLFLAEQNYNKALWLADKTITLISADDSNYQVTQELMLVKASSLLALNYIELSYQELKAIEQYTADRELLLPLAYYQTLSSVLSAKSWPVEALQADLHAFSLNTEQSKEQALAAVNVLWNKLQSLSTWQLQALEKMPAPYAKGWLQLTKYAHKFGSDNAQLHRYIEQWQRQFPTHPATPVAQQLLATNLTKKPVEHIAVLLPLTGKQQAAGIAAQQGVLAAYNGDEFKKLHFFDTAQLNWQTLQQDLAALNIDFVIGPLLKANVAQYLALTANLDEQASLDKDDEITAIPSIILNLPGQETLKAHQVALSMRPEDEAIQAASTLSQSNYKQPIVLSHQDAVSKRIAKAFTNQWQLMTGQNIEIVYFAKGKKMQANLKSSLDVDVSQERINELKSRVKQTIKSETRNRRDIDMIYVVGSPKQTRLVKPYIDVNISPFASVIPVYASSRSHSIKNDNSSSRDLHGLTFTEIPWLLASDQQNQALAQVSKQLWSKRSDSLHRIFAMGYDSYHLVENITLMQQAPYIRHYGQTGVLKLNDDNILTRSLLWGKYHNEGVKEIAMD